MKRDTGRKTRYRLYKTFCKKAGRAKAIKYDKYKMQDSSLDHEFP